MDSSTCPSHQALSASASASSAASSPPARRAGTRRGPRPTGAGGRRRGRRSACRRRRSCRLPSSAPRPAWTRTGALATPTRPPWPARRNRPAAQVVHRRRCGPATLVIRATSCVRRVVLVLPMRRSTCFSTVRAVRCRRAPISRLGSPRASSSSRATPAACTSLSSAPRPSCRRRCLVGAGEFRRPGRVRRYVPLCDGGAALRSGNGSALTLRPSRTFPPAPRPAVPRSTSTAGGVRGRIAVLAPRGDDHSCPRPGDYRRGAGRPRGTPTAASAARRAGGGQRRRDQRRPALGRRPTGGRAKKRSTVARTSSQSSAVTGGRRSTAPLWKALGRPVSASSRWSWRSTRPPETVVPAARGGLPAGRHRRWPQPLPIRSSGERAGRNPR
jgi:hypothetical protein